MNIVKDGKNVVAHALVTLVMGVIGDTKGKMPVSVLL